MLHFNEHSFNVNFFETEGCGFKHHWSWLSSHDSGINKKVLNINYINTFIGTAKTPQYMHTVSMPPQ